MLASIVRFTEDISGVEKCLRIVQYICHAALPLLDAQSAIPWKKAYEQSALGRRYFRLLSWHGSFAMAYQNFHGNKTGVRKMLEVAKWSFLGLYFWFEMFTISNAMGITAFEWGDKVQTEADKYWMYAIVASIFVSLHQLYAAGSSGTGESGGTGGTPELKLDKKRPTLPPASANAKIYRQLAIDCFDVVIPAIELGWLQWDEMYAGIAGTISSLIGAQEIWMGVQSKFASAQP